MPQALAAVGEIVALEQEGTDRVELEGIDAERDDEHVGAVAGDAFQGVIQRGGPFGVPGAARQGVIDVEPVAGALAGFVRVAEKIGEFLARVAVDGHEKHIVAGIEDVLGAVAVVEVDIEDRHPARAAIERALGGDGGIVEEAVAAVLVHGRVMARRPAEPERRFAGIDEMIERG